MATTYRVHSVGHKLLCAVDRGVALSNSIELLLATATTLLCASFIDEYGRTFSEYGRKLQDKWKEFTGDQLERLRPALSPMFGDVLRQGMSERHNQPKVYASGPEELRNFTEVFTDILNTMRALSPYNSSCMTNPRMAADLHHRVEYIRTGLLLLTFHTNILPPSSALVAEILKGHKRYNQSYDFWDHPEQRRHLCANQKENLFHLGAMAVARILKDSMAGPMLSSYHKNSERPAWRVATYEGGWFTPLREEREGRMRPSSENAQPQHNNTQSALSPDRPGKTGTSQLDADINTHNGLGHGGTHRRHGNLQLAAANPPATQAPDTKTPTGHPFSHETADATTTLLPYQADMDELTAFLGDPQVHPNTAGELLDESLLDM